MTQKNVAKIGTKLNVLYSDLYGFVLTVPKMRCEAKTNNVQLNCIILLMLLDAIAQQADT